MKLRLSDIPREGSTWTFQRGQELELDQAVADLIAATDPYQLVITIHPLDQNGTFQMMGKIKSEWTEMCSFCSEDFRYPLNQSFSEILMPKLEIPRDAHNAKIHHSENPEGLEHVAFEYENEHFELGEFMHEMLAIAQPFAPSPTCDASGNCLLCKKTPAQREAMIQAFQNPAHSQIKESPFAVLKNLKN